jgi:uncharacterized lipoprotein YmbA
MRQPSFVTLAFAVALGAAGCAGLPRTHYYVLDPPAAADADQGTEGGLVIGVRAFQVDPPYDQDRLVYRVGEGSPEIGFYDYHRWAMPLSRMLPKVAAGALSGIEGLRAVEPAAPGRSYPATIEGRVVELEEVDLPDGQSIRVRLVLRLRLADGSVPWSEPVAAEGTVETDDVLVVVEKMNEVLDHALRQARAGLAEALGQ